MRKALIAVMTWVALAGQAPAHPHIFVDTGVEVIFDAEGRAVAVKVAWVYDDFFSLMMIEDRVLDRDHDGNLTPEEEAQLRGFDMQWEPGYNGDLYVLQDGREIALGGPTDWTASYVAGRITSTHVRALETPVTPGKAPLVIQAYDTSFYTAYNIAGTPLLTGASAGCMAEVFEPDLAAADAALQAALDEFAGRDGSEDALEMDFPAVGAAYADEVRVTCPVG